MTCASYLRGVRTDGFLLEVAQGIALDIGKHTDVISMPTMRWRVCSISWLAMSSNCSETTLPSPGVFSRSPYNRSRLRRGMIVERIDFSPHLGDVFLRLRRR